MRRGRAYTAGGGPCSAWGGSGAEEAGRQSRGRGGRDSEYVSGWKVGGHCKCGYCADGSERLLSWNRILQMVSILIFFFLQSNNIDGSLIFIAIVRTKI